MPAMYLSVMLSYQVDANDWFAVIGGWTGGEHWSETLISGQSIFSFFLVNMDPALILL